MSVYKKDDLIQILNTLDFEMEYVDGKQAGKGDHVIYSHVEYKDLKLVIPSSRKNLSEDEMSSICSNLVIIMKIFGMDTSRFKRKEGVEGKIMKTVKNADKDFFVLFSQTVKNCLGLTDEMSIARYMKKQIDKYQNGNLSSLDALD